MYCPVSDLHDKLWHCRASAMSTLALTGGDYPPVSDEITETALQIEGAIPGYG